MRPRSPVGRCCTPTRHRKPKSKTAHKSTNKVDAKSRAHERPPEPGQRRSHSPHPRRSHRRGHDLTSRTFYTVISVRTNPDSRRATLDSIPHRTPSRRKIHTHIRRYRYFTVGTRDLEPHNVQLYKGMKRRAEEVASSTHVPSRSAVMLSHSNARTGRVARLTPPRGVTPGVPRPPRALEPPAPPPLPPLVLVPLPLPPRGPPARGFGTAPPPTLRPWALAPKEPNDPPNDAPHRAAIDAPVLPALWL